MYCILLVLSMLLSPGGIARSFTPAGEKPPVVTLHVESGQPAMVRGGENTLLCTLEIPEGYHVYWNHPGASGDPTEIDVDAPDEYEIGAMRWPRPEVFHEPEGMTYGYSDRVTFIIPFRNAVQFPEPGDFVVSARWLACKKACFMGSASTTIQVSLLEHVKLVPTEAMRAAAARMPKPVAERPATRVTLVEDRLVISGPVDPAGAPGFLPGNVPGVELGDPLLREDGRKFELVIPYSLHPGNALGRAPAVEGLLIFGMNPRDPSYTIKMPVPPLGPPDTGSKGSDGGED